MFGPNGAIEGHAERLVDHHAAELFDPLALEGELVIVEINMTNAEPFLQVLEVCIEVFGRVEAEAALENTAVAIATAVGTTAA